MTPSDTQKLPKGIKLCNPGNLREAVGPDFAMKTVDGFAVFSNMVDGLTSLYYLIDIYYNVHGFKTLDRFLASYAPAAENNLLAYQKAMCEWLRIDLAKITTTDLQLHFAWKAVDLARGLVRQEQGIPPTSWRGYPEWLPVHDHAYAIMRTRKWLDA